ncbi:DsbA family protein [Actibacterium sp. XHP0104]|uniref:DsbA family protein n=1 Tax=Actibacterium sp. XHP0104 TaxID=2984335 RepID=UPI0021E92772|nr:DsbA family protein [Actibacterium sp. XHP0104]MCV2881981.1 DsbA family protein [Actibacterium sp. XHP0104]
MDRRTALILGTGAVAAMATPMSALANEEAAAEAAAPEIIDYAIGAEDAPVTVIEYASFTCPHCRAFHEEVMPKLKADYIETGKVRMIYREVYFDGPGLWAAMVARCGGEARYFAITDMLYEKQREWIGDGSGNAIVQNLRKIGLAAGLTAEELDQCLSDGATAQALYDHDQANRKEYAIEGTPSLVVNGTLHGNLTYKGLKEAIDEAL